MGEGQAKRRMPITPPPMMCMRCAIRGDGQGNGVDAVPGDRAVTGNPVGHMNVVALPRLRWRIQRHHAVRELEVPITGAEAPYRVIAPADPDAVLDQTARAFARHEAAKAAEGAQRSQAHAQHGSTGLVGASSSGGWHMPYWATPWASGLAVAEAVVAEPGRVAGARVMELGCGLGITAMALVRAGARLTVVDCWGETLAFCRYNALRAGAQNPPHGAGIRAGTIRTRLADWRTDPGRDALIAGGPYDLVVAADVLYEPEDIPILFALLPRLVGPAGAVWLAEPGRTTSRKFVQETDDAGWIRDTTTVTRDPWPADAGRATVRMHRYTGIGLASADLRAPSPLSHHHPTPPDLYVRSSQSPPDLHASLPRPHTA